MKERTLLDLPPEIVLGILENLSDKDAFLLGLSCRQLYGVTSSYIELGKFVLILNEVYIIYEQNYFFYTYMVIQLKHTFVD